MFRYWIAYEFSYDMGRNPSIQKIISKNIEYDINHQFGQMKSDPMALIKFLKKETGHECTVLNVMFLGKD